MLSQIVGISYVSFCSILLYKAIQYGNIIKEPTIYDSDEDTLVEPPSVEILQLKEELEILKSKIKVLEHENLQMYLQLKEYQKQ
jgi:hypothetical protein